MLVVATKRGAAGRATPAEGKQTGGEGELGKQGQRPGTGVPKRVFQLPFLLNYSPTPTPTPLSRVHFGN